MNYVLYNPISGHGKSEELARSIVAKNSDTAKAVNMTEIVSYKDFFSALSDDDVLTICGGDGTVNRFVNDTAGIEFKNKFFYFKNY